MRLGVDPVVAVRAVTVALTVAVAALLVGPWWPWVSGRVSLALVVIVVGGVAVGLTASGVYVARYVRAPSRSTKYLRVRRSLVVRYGDAGSTAARRGAATSIVLDGLSFDASQVQDVAVVVLAEEDNSRSHPVGRAVLAFADAEEVRARTKVQFLPTVILGSVAYELDRLARPGEAQALGDCIASALAGEPRTARTINARTCLPKAVLASIAVRVVAIMATANGAALAHASNILCACGVAAVLAVDLVCTEWDGWTFGQLRTVLAKGWLDGLQSARLDVLRERGPAGYREGAHGGEATGAVPIEDVPSRNAESRVETERTRRKRQLRLLLLVMIVGAALLGPEVVRLSRLLLGAGH
jgi:hypothetical protein